MNRTNQIFLFLIAILLSIRCTSQNNQMNSNLLTPEQLDKKPYFFSLEKALENPDSVYRLALTNKGLTEFPDKIFQFKNLQEVVISGNEITIIPEKISELSNLQRFFAGNNNLEKLPQGLFELKHLKVLALPENLIIELPKEIGSLETLNWLILRKNYIKIIPSSIGELSKLKELDLAVNPIKTLPMEIGKLTTLEKLDISGFVHGDDFKKYETNTNVYLKELPQEITALNQLVELKLQGTAIKELPDGMEKMKNLKVINLVFSPFLVEKKLKDLEPKMPNTFIAY